jgi:hypothetical protein
MALKKKKEYKNGTAAEYHNIASILITPITVKERVITRQVTEEERKENPKARTEFEEREVEKYALTIKARSYVSEQVRRKDPNAFLETFLKCKDINKENFTSADLFAQAYTLIKEDSEFADAEDA